MQEGQVRRRVEQVMDQLQLRNANILNKQDVERITKEVLIKNSPSSSDPLSPEEEKLRYKKRTRLKNDDHVYTPVLLLLLDSATVSVSLSSISDDETTIYRRNNSEYAQKMQQFQKDLELEQIRREFQLRETQLEEEKEQEKHERDMEILRLHATIQHYEKQMESVMKQTSLDEMQSLQMQIAKLQQENNDLTEQTKILNSNLKETIDANDKLKRDYNHLLKVKEDVEQDYQTQLQYMEKTQLQLKGKYQELFSSTEEIRAKESVYDTALSKAAELETNMLRFQSQIELVESKYNLCKEEKDKIQDHNIQLTQQIQLLSRDKVYLIKENETLTLRNKELEDTNQLQKDDLLSAIRLKDQYHSQLLDITIKTKTETVQEREEAIMKLQEQTRKDLAKIKKNAKEAYERELRMLKESRDSTLMECENLRTQVKELKDAHEVLTSEYKNLGASLESQISEARTQLKFKAFENERISATNLELSNNLRNCKNESEILKKKLDVIKNAYHTIESEYGKKIAELEVKLGNCNRELQQYKELEDQLDKTLEVQAEVPQDDMDIAKHSVPSVGYRRLKHSLYLAKKVSEMNKTVAEYKHLIEEKEKELEHRQQIIQQLNRKLEHVSHPYNYIVNTLENREEEVVKLKAQVKSFEKEIKKLKKTNQKIEEEKVIMQKDIQELLSQKSAITALKTLLTQMKEQH